MRKLLFLTIILSAFVLAPVTANAAVANGGLAFVHSGKGVVFARSSGPALWRVAAGATDPAFSPGGNRVAYVGDGDIYESDIDGGAPVRLVDVNGAAADPAWSPDGTKIAYTSTAPGGDAAVAVSSADGATTAMMPPPQGSVSESQPAWSPDGSGIAFVSDGLIFLAAADGSGAAPLLSVHDGIETTPEWTPDGATIAFARDGVLWFAGTDGTNARAGNTQSVVGITTIAISPDGTEIAYDGMTQGFTEMSIHVTPINGGIYGLISPPYGASFSEPAWQPVSDTTPPVAPAGPTATGSDRAVTIAFTPPAAADYLGVFVVRAPLGSEPNVFVYPIVGKGRGSSVRVTELVDNGARWTFGVYAFDRLGNVSSLYAKVDGGAVGPARVTLALSRSDVVYPGSFTLTGTVVCGWLTISEVAIERRTPGTTAWSRAATTYLDRSKGTFRTTYTPSATTELRAKWGPEGGCTTGTSPIVRAGVRVAIQISPVKTLLRRGDTLRVSGSIRPAHPSRWVWLQIYDGSAKVWRTVMSFKLTSRSEYWLSYRSASPGYRLARIVYPTQDTDHIWNVTSAFKVTWS